MKVKTALVLLCCFLATVTYAQDEEDGTDFNGDFFQGMESGFFLRDT